MVSTVDFSKLVEHLTPEELANIVRNSDNSEQLIRELIGDKKEYPKDPVLFAKEVLGIELWSKQREIVRSVIENPQTVVESSKGIGKSLTAAILSCFWMVSHPSAMVVTLAPTHKHVNSVIWKYIRSAGRGANLPGEILDTPRWKLDDDHQAVGLSPRRGTKEDITALQGYHDPHLLVIIDEAAAFNRLFFDAIAGLTTAENNRTLAIGNPIAQSGPFYEATKSPYWNYIHVSALESPNVIAKKEIIPGLTSYRWVLEQIDHHCQAADDGTPGAFEFEGEWYKPDNYFMTQVLGVAPLESEDQLVPLQWIRSCQIIDIQPKEGASPVMGFDPSEGGDDAAMVIRIGGRILKIERKKPLSKNKTEEQADWIAENVRQLGITQVYVDAIGGLGVVDACRRKNIPVYAVKFSFAARTNRFSNLRSESYWILREMLQKERLALPEDDMLEADIMAQKYTHDALGRIKLEDKRQVKKRIGRSPDSSDALAITFSMGPIEEGILMSAHDVNTLRKEDGSRWHLDSGMGGEEGGIGRNRYGGSRWRKFSKRGF